MRSFLHFLSIDFYYQFYYEEQLFRTLKSPKLEYLATHLCKKKIHTPFENHICTDKLEECFFEKNFFFKDIHFFHEKLILYFFSSVII